MRQTGNKADGIPESDPHDTTDELEPLRPERTREHYIEAISRNYVERLFLLKGHTVDRPSSDYGYDMVVVTFNYRGDQQYTKGEIENGSIYIQLKATDNLKFLKDEKTIAFRIKRRHASFWVMEPMPVYLIVYSVAEGIAYWLHMQTYLQSSDFQWPPVSQEELTVHLSRDAVLKEETINEFRWYKEAVVRRIRQGFQS